MFRKWIGRLLIAAMIGGAAYSCEGFVESDASNPNIISNANFDELAIGVQVNVFFFNESVLSRMAAVFLQQMAGTDRQFIEYDRFRITEEDGDDPYNAVYAQGGLTDTRLLAQLAADANNFGTAGVAKLHEAFLVGMAASVFGDVPYTEAGDPTNFPFPNLDEQLDVYADVQLLLTEAIGDLGQGDAVPLGAKDLNFGGDLDSWIGVAHSLKARFHLHTAEVNPGAYALAEQEALLGIADPSGNWVAPHTLSFLEPNLWYLFAKVRRTDYISGGAFGVDLLDINGNQLYDAGIDDPRLPLLYTEGGGASLGLYIGDPQGTPSEPGTDASDGNIPWNQDYSMPIIGCSETQFILAEARVGQGNFTGARTAAQAGLDCEEAYWGGLGFPIDLGIYDVNAVPDAALLEFIIEQKYLANFLNIEIWQDYKRTCLPAITVNEDVGQWGGVPGRLFYSDDERQNNPNIDPPGTGNNGLWNDNDPSQGC